MSRRYDYYGWYTPAPAREVKGGIKAQSKRGNFASKWWGKRWIEALESFRIGARLSRGRSYARRGQVASLEIEPGEATAKVQGSRSKPYLVEISLPTYSPKQWRQVIDLLIEQPILAARLLGNEMPEEIEEIFTRARLPLFPGTQNDLTTDCSCPDWSNPCKHIAAVFYLMAEAFDNDPFLLFKLRGMERDDLLNALQEGGANREESEAPPAPEPETLPLETEEFWGRNKEEANPGLSPVPQLHAALPKRLGPIPLWRSDKSFLDEMESVYQNASGQAENWFNKISGM